jgi:hypothetical protein
MPPTSRITGEQSVQIRLASLTADLATGLIQYTSGIDVDLKQDVSDPVVSGGGR